MGWGPGHDLGLDIIVLESELEMVFFSGHPRFRTVANTSQIQLLVPGNRPFWCLQSGGSGDYVNSEVTKLVLSICRYIPPPQLILQYAELRRGCFVFSSLSATYRPR